jgi:hypothetical protein
VGHCIDASIDHHGVAFRLVVGRRLKAEGAPRCRHGVCSERRFRTASNQGAMEPPLGEGWEAVESLVVAPHAACFDRHGDTMNGAIAVL